MIISQNASITLIIMVIRSSRERTQSPMSRFPISTDSFTTDPADNHLRGLNHSSVSDNKDRGPAPIISLPRS